MNICITNQKGGSGKTSFAILVSLAIASKGYRVLCIDCDPQGGLTSYLSKVDYKKKRKGLFDILTGDDNYNIIPIERHGIQLDLIPADHRLDSIYANLSPYEFEHKFNDLNYHFIIFDTPPTVQGISRAAAIVADNIFVPADLSEGTINPTLYTIDALKKIKKIAKVILLGYKEPDPDSKAFKDAMSREFKEALVDIHFDSIPATVNIKRIVSDEKKISKKITETILNAIEVM